MMSAKLLSSLTDENKNLKKQIGCMNRIFQLFGNAHFLSGRGMGSNNHMRLLPGQNANHKMEPNSGRPKAKDKRRKELVKEKERVSVESSRTSFSSSSCSSTFSSVECSKAAKPEPPSSTNSNFHESASEILTMKQKSPWGLGQQTTDLRDVVKDSIYREARELSVKTRSKDERLGHTVKHVDSPRPMQLCESVKSKVSGVDGSPRVLDDSSSLTLSRYSFDGRNSRDTQKSNTKLKELPRLSLDSRAGTIRSSASVSRANYLLADPNLGNGNSNQILNTRQEPASNRRPSSSVVAKLMGLEAFPDSVPTTQLQEIKSFPDEDLDSLTRSSGIPNENKQHHVFGSPRNFQRDHDSPRLRNSNSVMKPTSSSWYPLEPAPPPEGSLGSQKPAFVCEAPTKALDPSPSVYGEIEKRLRELEFKKSGKDLRALKQILEAMRKTRGRLEGKKEECASNFEVQTGNYNSLDQSSKFTTHLRQQSDHLISPTIKGTSPQKRSEPPILTIKPAKLIEKPRKTYFSATPVDSTSYLRSPRTGDFKERITDTNDKRTAKDLTPRNIYLRDPSSWSPNSMNKNTGARAVRSIPILKVPEHMAQENPTSSTRSSGTMSPRLQQKKNGMERQSRLSTPSSNPNRARRRSSKQSTESCSPRRQLKPKSPILQQGEDQLSETSRELRTWSYQGDAISVQSESNISLSSKTESEVTNSSCYSEISSIYQQKDQKIKNLAASLSGDNSIAELTTATLEQPSPVSVLDATFYIEDLPSPVKKISNAFQDDETRNPEKAEWNLVDTEHLLSNTIPNSSSVFYHKEQENTMHLHNLRQPNSSHDEATEEYLASLHDNTSQDHRYITEIMIASRLLKHQGSSSTTMQLYPSGHLINPGLFFVLEQSKNSTRLQNDIHSTQIISQKKPSEKIRRRLVFDTVNEILVRKSASAGSFGLWTSPNKLGGENPSEKKFLKELFSEIDRLQPNKGSRLDDEEDGLISILSEDMISQSENWVDHHGGVPGVVLDIERLIFKDLIDEVVSCESVALKGRPRRQLCPAILRNCVSASPCRTS